MNAVIAALILAVFRVSIHEGAFANVHETALIWQVARSHGRDSGARLAWLYRHSHRVFAQPSPWHPVLVSGNEWAGALDQSCESPPSFDQQWWTFKRAPRCKAIYTFTQELVEGRVTDVPCDPLPSGKRDPDSWAAASIHASRLRLGYRQHVCHGVLNEGWSW